MTETRKTGIYIGNQAFYFAKLEDKTGNNFFEVPFGISGERVQILTDKSIEILDLTANIKKALDENRVTAAQAHLALPAHEIIFRSFNVPFMQPQEVKNVVAFEASKYVPFKLDELIYTYYPLTTTENKRRVIRVLFAAVKKERIQTYSYLFSQAGFSIEHIEPGFFSLLRALTFKKQLPANKTIGIIECYPRSKHPAIRSGVSNFPNISRCSSSFDGCATNSLF